MELSEAELESIFEWTQANCENHLVAKAFWSLLGAKACIEEAMQALDAEWDTISAGAQKANQEPEMSDEFAETYDLLEKLDDAWFDARERLARRCLDAMRAVG